MGGGEGEEEVVLWTSDTFRFIVSCHKPLFYMLASLCSLAIFEKPDHSDAWAVQTMVPTVFGLCLKGEAE